MRGLIDIATFSLVASTVLSATGALIYYTTGPHIYGVSPRIYVTLFAYATVIALITLVSRIPLSYITGNLSVRWLTTLMTAVAFSLVTMLLTIMLAFVNGMYALTAASGHPENVIILSEGSTDEGFSNLGFGDVGDIESQPGIVADGQRRLCSRETYIVANQPVANPKPGRPKRRLMQLRGIDDPITASIVHGIELHSGGEWFSEAGVREMPASAAGDSANQATAIEAVLGEGIARELGKDRTSAQLAAAPNRDRLEVGDTMRLNDRTWVVAGVMKSSGSTFDSEIWAKQSLIGPIFGKTTYTTLVARTASSGDAIRLKDYLKEEYKKSAVTAQVETDYFASLSETNKQFLYAIAFVTIFMAMGGFFGVMNTMFATISQRIKDIGVLRLLGFGRGHVLATFLLESVVIAIVGGALGCFLGSLWDGVTANSIVSGGPGGGKFIVLRLTVDAQIIALCMLLTVVMGFLGGLLPSLRAMRTTALETLR